MLPNNFNRLTAEEGLDARIKVQSLLKACGVRFPMLTLCSPILQRAGLVGRTSRPNLRRTPTQRAQQRSFHASKNLKDTVYAFGDNTHSQCGVLEEKKTMVPRRVQELPKDIKIEAVIGCWKGTFVLSGTTPK